MSKWSSEEVEYVLENIKLGKTYKEIGIILNRGENSIRGKVNKLGLKSSTFYQHKTKDNNCIECGRLFNDLIIRERKFCSQSCNAIFNNRYRSKDVSIFIFCYNHSFPFCQSNTMRIF